MNKSEFKRHIKPEPPGCAALSLAIRVGRHPKCCGDLNGKGAMGVTKLRKRLARLLRLQDDNPHRHQRTQTCHNLVNRLALREHGWSERNVCQVLEVAKRDLSELRLDQWKHDFVSDMKFAGRWLRSRKGIQSPEIKPTNCPVAPNNAEAVEAIREYWTQFWRKVEESKRPSTTVRRLLRPPGPFRRPSNSTNKPPA